jgi:trans-aconitate 2-methyltransferase
MSWSAQQYVAFEQERTRPSRDLLAAIPPVQARQVIDLGCGPGNSTELLVEHFPDATVRGLDSSADMVEAARKRLPNVTFDTADIGRWNESGPFDVIFANAVLQWLPDHATLLPSLVDKLTPGGSLAIQMPDTLHQPSHRLMRDIAASGPWAGQLAGAADSRTEVEDASTYYSILKPHCSRVDVWRTT